METFLKKGWEIADGVQSVEPSEGKGGDIVTTDAFANYELQLDFRDGQLEPDSAPELRRPGVFSRHQSPEILGRQPP